MSKRASFVDRNFSILREPRLFQITEIRRKRNRAYAHLTISIPDEFAEKLISDTYLINDPKSTLNITRLLLSWDEKEQGN